MKTKFKYLLIALILMVSVFSCVKDNFNFDKWDKEINYEASFAAPVAWGDLSFTDALQMYDSTGLLIDNDDGYVSLQYLARVSSNKVNDIIFINDQNISGTVESPDISFVGFDSPGDTVSYIYTDYLTFSMFNAEAEIDSLIFKTGIMDIATNSTFFHSARLYVKFPSVTKNGVPFSTSFTYTPGGGNVVSLNNDFTGYNVDMTQTPANFNEIPVEIRLTLFWSGEVPNSGTVSFDVNMKTMQYKIMHGYFGENTLFFESDTIDISLFKSEEWDIESYLFMDPKFKIYYWNSYGVPSQFYFDHLVAHSDLQGDMNILDDANNLPIGPANPYDVNYAIVVGQRMLDSLKINRTNSNIDDVVNARPKWIQFKARATTNPAGLDHHNFVIDDSQIEVEVIMELPMWGYLYNWHSRDTAKVDLTDLQSDYNPLKRLMVRIDIQNGFPIEAFGQVYFTDENYVVLDSLFYTYEERLLSAAQVDADGRVLDFSRKVTKIEYVDARLKKLETCKYAIYTGQVNTTNASAGTVMKIYRDYRIKFDIGFEVDLGVEGNIDSISNEF
ncbi:MAG: hypothetical protein PHE33_02495 [Bacteroidales bacterium]|nr:hypothetical protein [Bacteroidales bacterium]